MRAWERLLTWPLLCHARCCSRPLFTFWTLCLHARRQSVSSKSSVSPREVKSPQQQQQQVEVEDD
jgi:hypothetical protein